MLFTPAGARHCCCHTCCRSGVSSVFRSGGPACSGSHRSPQTVTCQCCGHQTCSIPGVSSVFRSGGVRTPVPSPPAGGMCQCARGREVGGGFQVQHLLFAEYAGQGARCKCMYMHACVRAYIHTCMHARARAHTQVFLQRMCTPRDMPPSCLYNRLLSSSGSSLLILTKQTLNRL